MMGIHTLLVGIGSPHGDDQVGWLVVDELREQLENAKEIHFRKVSSPGDLLHSLEGVTRLVVCDACRTHNDGDSLGSAHDWQYRRIYRCQWPTPFDAPLRSSSSHAFQLPNVLRLAERLRILPPTVIVFGIVSEHFEPFGEVSPSLSASLPDIVAAIARDLSREVPDLNGEHVPHA